MDIRIVNKNNEMFAVGSRTLKVMRNEICLYDANSKSLEVVEQLADEDRAKGVEKWLIEKIDSRNDFGRDNIIIKL